MTPLQPLIETTGALFFLFSRSAFEYLANETGFKLVRWETYSNKWLVNLLYNRIHIGNKARVLVRRVE